jgi:hypothetical protein
MTTRRNPPKKPETFAAGVGRGMRRAARTAREVARMHGTPIYVWEDVKSWPKSHRCLTSVIDRGAPRSTRASCDGGVTNSD